MTVSDDPAPMITARRPLILEAVVNQDQAQTTGDESESQTSRDLRS
jgi:hypothetical protein